METSLLRIELERARAETDKLFRIVSAVALYERPVAERHRLIFYLGHLDAFDWNILARRSKSERSFHPTFDSLFERGIDPPPGQAPADSAADWPRREEIERYNARTRDWIDRRLPELDPWVVQMAIEHRLMHAETLAYLMHNLPAESKHGRAPVEAERQAPENPMLPIAAGKATLGKDNNRFGWDNEHPACELEVGEFAMSRFKISNGEYLRFVQEGGAVPNFWAKAGDRWMWRCMFGQIPLPLAWPVWVTWRQADAYAKWRGVSLPSEAQWHRASEHASPAAHRDNYGFVHWDPVPTDSCIADAEGPIQLTGNGWEWTSDLFSPFEGFEPHPFYPGYSADFFDGQHYVMKGASPRTAALMARPSFRNWFRPEYPYMYAGFRVVR